jgi:wobble nucleotide-excising tRNase
MSDKEQKSELLAPLHQARDLGKEGAKIVTDVQSENHRAVLNEQRKREAERRAKEKAILELEFKAFDKFQKEEERKRMISEMEGQIVEQYGKGGLARVKELKEEIRKQDEEDKKLMKKDEEKINDMFWWVVGVTSLMYAAGKLFT